MITRNTAIKEKDEILKKSRISKMSDRDIIRSINITDYLGFLDNLSLLLTQCPESIERNKCIYFWDNILKVYLYRVMYQNPALQNVIMQEEHKIYNMSFPTVSTFKEELKNFFETTLIPGWTRPWETH